MKKEPAKELEIKIEHDRGLGSRAVKVVRSRAMEQQQLESSAGEMMVFGLIEQADRMGKSAQGSTAP